MVARAWNEVKIKMYKVRRERGFYTRARFMCVRIETFYSCSLYTVYFFVKGKEKKISLYLRKKEIIYYS